MVSNCMAHRGSSGGEPERELEDIETVRSEHGVPARLGLVRAIHT